MTKLAVKSAMFHGDGCLGGSFVLFSCFEAMIKLICHLNFVIIVSELLNVLMTV